MIQYNIIIIIHHYNNYIHSGNPYIWGVGQKPIRYLKKVERRASLVLRSHCAERATSCMPENKLPHKTHGWTYPTHVYPQTLWQALREDPERTNSPNFGRYGT